jgi:predicted metal-dependent peptidase
MVRQSKSKIKLDPATLKFMEAQNILCRHPMFAPLMNDVCIVRSEGRGYPKNGYAYVTSNGTIYVHPKRHEETEVWVYVLAHCLLHLGFEHFIVQSRQDLWNIACNVYLAKFLDDFKLGQQPRDGKYIIQDLSISTEEKLYEDLLEKGVDKRFLDFGTGNPGEVDMIFEPNSKLTNRDWGKRLGVGLRNAVTSAVNVAAGKQKTLASQSYANSDAQRARSWFMSSYPLLGSLASSFEIIEDPDICQQMDISVAAVHPQMKEIYINPAAGLTEDECKFVIAHELLHVGLRHDTRRHGRDPYLWNVACDYVINSWLVEMQLGDMPPIGALYDPTLKGESAESVYYIITTDLRKIRKLSTLKGTGKSDILEPAVSSWWAQNEGTDLDSFYRRSLMQGLEYHSAQGRGLLPAGLIEEVKALAHPPLPWDVELAQWFDGHFSPLEKVRSYAKPSRRQSGSPDIQRPKYIPLWGAEENRTFGILLDTSGSIYDQGYVSPSPEELMERVNIMGRDGTLLQPGINLLEKAEDFPKEGPILIITDGGCEFWKFV